MLPTWLVTLTLNMCTSIHINFLCVLLSWSAIISVAFKSILSKSCSLEPKNFLRVPKTPTEGLRAPPQTLQLRWRPLSLFFRWLCLVFYRILFAHGFSDIHLGNKIAAKKSDILFGQGKNRLISFCTIDCLWLSTELSKSIIIVLDARR